MQVRLQRDHARDALARIGDLERRQLGCLLGDGHIGVVDPARPLGAVLGLIGDGRHLVDGGQLPAVRLGPEAGADGVDAVDAAGGRVDLQRPGRVGGRDGDDARPDRRALDAADLARPLGIDGAACLEEGVQHLALVVVGRRVGADGPGVGVGHVGGGDESRNVDARQLRADAADLIIDLRRTLAGRSLPQAQRPLQSPQDRVGDIDPGRGVVQTACTRAARVGAVKARVPTQQAAEGDDRLHLSGRIGGPFRVLAHHQQVAGLARQLVRRSPARQAGAVLQAGRGNKGRIRLGPEPVPVPELIGVLAGDRHAAGVEGDGLVVGLDTLEAIDGPGARQHRRDAVVHEVRAEGLAIDGRARHADAPRGEGDGAVRVQRPFEGAARRADLGLKR
ncbi:hypothetical protein D3C72_1184220 [compost metagenome]